ncbi:hypothetical protein DS745_07600 [Anaerobacillus alkaliphilus]|uniref:Uncharacterized protein n=1 Tax=Anaerobacillus alkaliphilus TaxID=1548597 RepID=A0A4Q0VUZ8_9BACI|nr:hypothetical protein [Anaerobacillus alkaliphilus]RXJ02244.1 hypothetical protein DS745_07600 [Anaerobacillus alkaliphilus]
MILGDLLIGIVSGGITSFAVTKYYKEKEERENEIKKQIEKEEMERKQIHQEYIEFKQYLHELKQFINNIYSVWDIISETKDNDISETRKSLNKLYRYLMVKPYDVTSDFKIIQLDEASREHLNNIDESITELMDFISSSLDGKSTLNREVLVEKVLYLSLAFGKTRVTKIEGKTVTCDFYIP